MSAAVIALALCAGLSAGPVAPDELSIAQVTGPAGTVVRVPVRVRDLGGTILNEGDGPDNEIQSFAFQIAFPATFVDASNFVHAGVTAGRTAFFSQVTPNADNIVVLKSFNETTNALVFTLNAPLPGDVIGELEITIDPAAPNGTLIPLTLQTNNAALIDASATESETVANGNLLLRNGSITVGFVELIFGNGFE